MPSTSAVYLSMRLCRARELVEEEVDGVSVDAHDGNGDEDEAVTVRLDGDEAWVATIEAADADADAGSDPSTVRVEYPTDGPPPAQQTATRVRRLLTRRAE